MTHEEKIKESLQCQLEIESTKDVIDYFVENAKRISEEYEMDIDAIIYYMCCHINALCILNKEQVVELVESAMMFVDAGRINPIKTKLVKRERKQ